MKHTLEKLQDLYKMPNATMHELGQEAYKRGVRGDYNNGIISGLKK